MFNCVFEQEDPLEILPVLTQAGEKKMLGLRVSGDCMETTASDGDYIVIAPTSTYEIGGLVVAKLNGDCTLKRIYIEGKTAILKPDNKAFKPIRVPLTSLKIVGSVRYMVRKFSPRR